jgi:tetratricopeptide (TPR) repeat protein
MFRETLNAASESGNAFETLKSQYFLSLTLANLGRISEALETLAQGMRMAERNGDLFWSSRVPNAFGWIHRELQDFQAALDFDRQGAEAARRLGVVEAEVNSLINMGVDHLDAGDRQGMSSVMDSVESILWREPWFRWRFEIRFHAARAEQTLSKREGLVLLEKAARSRARKYMIAAHTILAQIAMAEGDPATAEAQLSSALTLLGEFPAPLVAWKTYSTLGRLHAQLGNRDAARAAFEQASSIITYIANHISDERLCATFLTSPSVQDAILHSRA